MIVQAAMPDAVPAAEDDDTLPERVVEFRTLASREANEPPPPGELVPGHKRRRRVKLGSHSEVTTEMKRVYAAIARGDIAPLEGGRQIRALKSLAEAMSTTEIERRIDAIVVALKRGGLMR